MWDDAMAPSVNHEPDTYPQKFKASKVASPLWEVNVRGEPIDDVSRKIPILRFVSMAHRPLALHVQL